MDTGEIVVETTGSLARKVGVSEATIRLYVKNGWIESSRTEDGRRLYRPTEVAKARAIYEKRMSGKGYFTPKELP